MSESIPVSISQSITEKITKNITENTNIHIPYEVICYILHYVNPPRLHKLASYSTHARHIVNTMNRSKYIEKWIDLIKCNNYTKYVYDIESSLTATQPYETLEYILNNYWYYILSFGNHTHQELQKIICRIHDKRLYLNLSATHIEDVSMLDNIHTLDLSECPYISNLDTLSNIHSLDLYDTDIASYNIRVLHNVHTLALSTNNIPSFDTYYPLANVYNLNLSYCTISDVTPLTNIYNLNLSYCTGVKNVNMLANVHTLNLSGSTYNITPANFSSLTNVHTLIMTYAHTIIDARCFNNVYNLDLTFNRELTNCGIQSLGNVNTLNLSYCTKITDTAFLRAVRNLDLSATNVDPHTYTYSAII